MQFSFHTTLVSYGKKDIQQSFDNYLVRFQNFVKDSLSLKNHISRFYFFSADYAMSDYTTVGIQIGYRRVNLQQTNKTTSAPLQSDYYNNYDLSVKGSNIITDLKLTRYFTSNARRCLYAFVSAGYNMQNFKLSDTRDSVLKATVIDDNFYNTSSIIGNAHFEIGAGAKLLVTNSLGVSLEAGLLYNFYRVGFFYNLKHASRKKYDKYGW